MYPDLPMADRRPARNLPMMMAAAGYMEVVSGELNGQWIDPGGSVKILETA